MPGKEQLCPKTGRRCWELLRRAGGIPKKCTLQGVQKCDRAIGAAEGQHMRLVGVPRQCGDRVRDALQTRKKQIRFLKIRPAAARPRMSLYQR